MFFIWVVVKIMAPSWGTLNIRCRIIIRTQKGTIILTTTPYVLIMTSCGPKPYKIVGNNPKLEGRALKTVGFWIPRIMTTTHFGVSGVRSPKSTART